MKNTMTIGIAALLVGGAGGFIAGKAGQKGTEASDTEMVSSARDSKSKRAGAGGPAATEGKGRTRSLDEILREPGQLSRMQALMELYASMSPDQLKAEAAKLERLPQSQRIMASLLLFGRWAETDPTGALDFSNRMGPGGMFVRPTILQSWASVDPQSAAAYFAANPREFAMMGFGGPGGPGGGDAGAGTIASEWAKLDPDAALNWANSLGNERDKSNALSSVVREIAAKDPSKAAQVAATLTGDDQTRAYREIAGQWGSTDFAAAKSWINGLPAEDREQALASALSSYASTDPVKASAEVAAMAAGRDRDRAVESIAEAWARNDPAAAAAWAVQQQTDNGDAIRNVMNNWVGQDSTAALAFIQQQPAGEVRDSAAASYVFSNRTGDPQQSIQLAETITDEGDRDRAIGVTAMRWMREDETAARAYIESSSNLSDQAKERLLNGGRGGRWGGGGGGQGGPGGRRGQ